jgi:hypothetical protein
MKNGYYAASTWVTDTDGKSYYFNMACHMLRDAMTPDGFYVDANGVWDGNPSTIEEDVTRFGPSGPEEKEPVAYWVEIDGSWKYCIDEDVYLTDSWIQDEDGNWYYLDADGNMLTSTMTPDGYYVDADGVWTDAPVETADNAAIETSEEAAAAEAAGETAGEGNAAGETDEGAASGAE